MKKIKIPRGEGFKRLENLIKYQIDNFKDSDLKEADLLLNDIKTDSSLAEYEKEEMREEIREILRVTGDFMSVAKRIQEGEILETTDLEFITFFNFVKFQLGLSEDRISDFKEDVFGWGKDKCQVLIDDEIIFYNEIKKFYEENCEN